MIDEIIATRAGGRLRIALREAGRLMELLFDDGAAPGAVGDIVLGRVTAVLKGMEACFVDIGAERAGFLSLAARGGEDDSFVLAEVPAEGATILVQVTKVAQMGKGAGLTRNISLAGRFLVFTPYQNRVAISRRIENPETRDRLEAALAPMMSGEGGFIVRTAAADTEDEALAADAAALRALWDEIVERRGNVGVPGRLHGEGDGLAKALRDRAHGELRRVIVDARRDSEEARAFFAEYLPGLEDRVELWTGPEPVFEAYGIEDEIEDALEPEIGLPCGGSLIIETTHAFTAIDVNTARNTGRSGHAATVRATNLEAAAEIACQLRLRNLGGLTVIDFIHMDDADDRDDVLGVLMDALAEDPAFIRATGFSELGLVELARRRGTGPLRDRITEGGAGEGDGDEDVNESEEGVGDGG